VSPFVLLKHPATYVACDWDLGADHQGRHYWAPFFKRHLETIFSLGRAAELARGGDPVQIDARIAACRTEFHARFDAFDTDPTAFGRVTILTLDIWRDQILRRHGFVDCFIDLKDRENEKLLPLLPTVCAQLDAMDAAAAAMAIIEGVLAGNIFDMGAEATAKQFLTGTVDFFATRQKLAPRPWAVDDVDALHRHLLTAPAGKLIFFVDNAGADFLLGALPFVRWLARRGWQVILAANERPTLNDMTAADIRRWWPRILAAEPSLASLPITIISTGTGEPLIDLSAVSPELNAAALGTTLTVIEGMGRGIESNLDAQFLCPTVNIGMLKDPMIAQRVGGKIYDCVVRFR
jgi:type II pantothenate kinase